MSKALDKSRKTTCTSKEGLQSKAEQISWVKDNSWFIKKSFFLNPDWHGLSNLCSTKKGYNTLNIYVSTILAQIGKRDTGG